MSRSQTPRVLAYNDLEGVYDDPERVAQLGRLVAKRRDERTLVVGAGDNTALGTVALVTDEGRALARPFLETIEADADTFGNHDLDFGREWALAWAERVPPVYTCLNVSGPEVASVRTGSLLTRGGNSVGIIGVAHPATADICGSVTDLVIDDPVEAATEGVAELRDRGADYVVVLSHCGARDRDVAAAVDADLVVGGHVHRRLCDRIDGTRLVRTAGGGHALAEVQLGGRSEPVFHDPASVSPDPKLAETYRSYRSEAGVEEPVASVTTPIKRTDAERFGGESRAGNFLADALRRAVDADIGLFPAGSLRDGPPLSGTVTVGDVVSLSPFGGRIQEVTVTGDELRTALDGMAVPHSGDRGWVHAHVSGARVRWDTDGRLTRIEVRGAPVQDGQAYTVATTGWLVEVASGFDPIAPGNVTGEAVRVYEAIVQHARDGGLAEAACEGRIRKAGTS